MNLSLKSFLVLTVMTSMTSSISLAAPSEVPSIKTGVFREIKSYGTRTLDRRACLKNGGIYQKAGKICVLKDGGSTIEISKQASEKYFLKISSIGTGSVTCDYEGEAQELNSNQLVSSDISESEPDGCEVTVSYKSENTINVNTKGICEGYCGYGMTLNVQSAHRIK